MSVMFKAVHAVFCYGSFTTLMASWIFLFAGFMLDNYILWDMGGTSAVLTMILAVLAISLKRYADVEKITF